MRLVVDTNVFVSAALKASSWPAHTIRWISRYGGLLKSDPTEQELLAVLQRPRFADKLPPWFLPDVRRILDAAEAVPVTELVALCRDPADDKFIELAVNGRADLIVSGDADLLSLDEVRGIPIVSPAAFVRAGTR
jgi:putative PIN family toxin of toxin-antitoxin system